MYAIWNVTSYCPWDCEFCCVSAKTIGKGEKDNKGGDDLDLETKMKILDQLVACGIKIDFSGGDPLYFEDDYALVSRAADLLPPKQINVSTTGVGFTEKKLAVLRRVGKVELTLDNVEPVNNPHRPKGYNLSSMNALKILVQEGIRCSAVTILYPFTMTKDNLRNIHTWLCENGVPQWDILRYRTVGKGSDNLDFLSQRDEYIEIMEFIKSLGGPVKIAFQHSLKLLTGEDRCRALHDSIGIMPDGTVVSCAWALDPNGKPWDGFAIGKVPEENLADVLKRGLEIPTYQKQPNCCRMG